jgi:hypothetical protein
VDVSHINHRRGDHRRRAKGGAGRHGESLASHFGDWNREASRMYRNVTRRLLVKILAIVDNDDRGDVVFPPRNEVDNIRNYD